MTTPARKSYDYTARGLALMARQVILTAPAIMKWLDPLGANMLLTFLGSPLHVMDSTIRSIERANNLACVLVNQCAYSMMLQAGEEMDREMEVQIPNMLKTLNLLEAIHPIYSIVNPLGKIVMEDRIYGYHSNMDSYQAILDLWHDTWEWTTTTVTEVTDGDTIYVAAYTDPIRVEGINCPEICHEEYDDCDPEDERWEAGYAAKEYAASLLLGKTVELRARKQRDYYDRVLAKVFIGGKDGAIFGNEMVKAGHAKFYTWCFPTTLSH